MKLSEWSMAFSIRSGRSQGESVNRSVHNRCLTVPSSLRSGIGQSYLASNYEKNAFVLVAHVGAVAFAFMIFPFQFWKGLRAWSVETRNGVHKIMGRVAITLLIFIAMPFSTLLAGGPSPTDMVSRWGFFCMAFAVVLTSGMGWRRARQKDFAEHRAWMTRCYGALLGGFFMFRLAAPFLTWVPIYILWPILCWGSWTSGLALAELYLWHTARDHEKYLNLIAAGRVGHLATSLQSHKDKA